MDAVIIGKNNGQMPSKASSFALENFALRLKAETELHSPIQRMGGKLVVVRSRIHIAQSAGNSSNHRHFFPHHRPPVSPLRRGRRKVFGMAGASKHSLCDDWHIQSARNSNNHNNNNKDHGIKTQVGSCIRQQCTQQTTHRLTLGAYYNAII